MDLEEEAYNIIRRHKEGVFQNVIWKELDIDSRKCSRIIKKLLDKDLIIREVGVSNGARTYLLKAKEEVKEKYDLLLAGSLFSACTGCTGDCQPEYCGRLGEWIGNLMEEAERSKETGEIKADIEDDDGDEDI
ncbi:helix-turn-helix transcriptional regulator [Methanosarcina sp. UBA289]|uniref:helix-turn-helix transcriptional regulator n=1 Tax=Methanosarcina sp. UBA289 TaxID=1915574 RepID=UPI0025D58D63|nr:Lrp/AsnC family transcriptional regulator [Methanosarcina sp. UBA289]